MLARGRVNGQHIYKMGQKHSKKYGYIDTVIKVEHIKHFHAWIYPWVIGKNPERLVCSVCKQLIPPGSEGKYHFVFNGTKVNQVDRRTKKAIPLTYLYCNLCDSFTDNAFMWKELKRAGRSKPK